MSAKSIFYAEPVVDHYVLPVRAGAMPQVLSLFEVLGFYKIEYEAHWDSGYAYFVENPTGDVFQLTEDFNQPVKVELHYDKPPFSRNVELVSAAEFDAEEEGNAAPECGTRVWPLRRVVPEYRTEEVVILPWVHVGIKCDIAPTMELILNWAGRHKINGQLVEAGFEEANNGKHFVSLPQLLWVDLELVPVRRIQWHLIWPAFKNGIKHLLGRNKGVVTRK